MSNIIKYHIHVPCDKWREFINNSDLRFFKYKKHLLNDLLSTKQDGVIVTMISWNYKYLKDAYALSNQIKHTNFANYLCYFEYEEDIIQYLCPYDTVDKNEETAVLITAAHKMFMKLDLERYELYEVIKQILLSLYLAFCEYNLCFPYISIDNICIEYVHKPSKIKYKVNDKKYIVESKLIVKIDEFVNTRRIYKTQTTFYDIYMFYTSVVSVLQQISEKYDITNIVNFVLDFQIADERIIHPMKTIDMILRKIHCELSK